jgi:C4-dicarboxylate transporter, DctQ subunit
MQTTERTKPWSRIDRFFSALIGGSGILSGFFILLTALLISFEVVMRYIFSAPTVWSFDITLFLIIYSAYVGAAFTMKEGKHVKVDFLINRIARYRTPRLCIGILTNVVLVLFWVLVTWRTFEESLSAYRLSEVTLSYLRFPMTIPLAAILIGGVLVLVQLCRELVGQFGDLFRRGL